MRTLCYDAGHVLGTEKAGEKLQAIYDILQGQNEKELSVTLSKVDTRTWLEMQRNAKLTFRIVAKLPEFKSKETVSAFAWDERPERTQSDRCRVLSRSSHCFASNFAHFEVMGV